MSAEKPLSFQRLILTLHDYWSRQGCVILQPYDVEVGAGTLHPATVLRALGPKPWRAAYVQPSRRPSDGRYGENPNRLQHYYQYQVILKPNPPEMQALYLGSLEAIGIDPALHDLRFVEDDWENPTVGAWGLGWEVWCDGMEVSQYTYFQQVGGLDVDPVAGELTYGLERLAMYVQGVDNVYDLAFNDAEGPDFKTYGDVFLENERQFSAFNFEVADVEVLKRQFGDMEAQVSRILERKGPQGQALALPAYDHVLKASHLFNLMDARGAIAVAERQSYIGRIRDLCKACALAWVEEQGGGGMIDHHAPGAIGRARRLRREATLPEKRLWAELRKFDPQFRRQAPIGRYVVDFACHRAALVVEIDGARHDLPEAQLLDYERTAWLNSQGYRVLRFRNEEVLADAVGVAEAIGRTIKALPLDGGGLGGGVRTGVAGESGQTSPIIRSAPTVRTPPSPTLPPSRGKGE